MFKDKSFKELLDFNYNINHKVYGLIEKDEAHELFYEGFITKLFEPEKPKTIGIFELMVYDLEKARKFGNFDTMIEMIKDLSDDFGSRFTRIQELVDDYDLGFKDKDRIVFLKNCIILPEYRSRGVLYELMKSIYLTHFTKNSLFVANTIPIQNLQEEIDFHNHDYEIDIQNGLGKNVSVMSGKYFKLNSLPAEDEEHDYKLFAKMMRMNFKQFKNTNFFYQDTDKGFSKIFKSEKKTLKL